MAQVDTRLALLPAQGVAGISNSVDNAFNTYYKSSANARQNALLDLQTQNQEANLSRQNALLDLQTQAAGREAEKHTFQMDAAKGAQLYRAMESLEKVPSESRVAQIEFMKDGLRKYGFDDDDWDILATDEGLAQGKAILSQYKPIASDAGTREFNSLTQGLNDQEIERARRIKLGLDPRASTSADERIASDQELTNAVADSKAAIAGKESAAKEKGKLEEQLELMPKVRAAIKEAETTAQDKGETAGAYKRAKAALPGLMEVSNRLKALADVATYTMAGKAWDGLVKQLGFGETEGSTARATMESIVDNQVLPLLRDTFGAAFTAAEGERLRNTLLDPDNAPEAKKASLDAFLEQKMRNLEAQERELGVETQQSLSIDDLVTKYAN